MLEWNWMTKRISRLWRRKNDKLRKQPWNLIWIQRILNSSQPHYPTITNKSFLYVWCMNPICFRIIEDEVHNSRILFHAEAKLAARAHFFSLPYTRERNEHGEKASSEGKNERKQEWNLERWRECFSFTFSLQFYSSLQFGVKRRE